MKADPDFHQYLTMISIERSPIQAFINGVSTTIKIKGGEGMKKWNTVQVYFGNWPTATFNQILLPWCILQILTLNFNTLSNYKNPFRLISRKISVMRKMTLSVHGGVINNLIYFNRGTVLKQFVMLEKESGPVVVVELPGSLMVWRGVERVH